ncbi:MAG: hypothetical protein ACYS5V_01630 [Planctomycetota bacterium]|jgi:hypothetical protein
MEPEQIREAILEHLAGGVELARQRFDAETGRFLADGGGWAVTNQDVIFPLAVLFTAEGGRWGGDSEVLELAELGGDALRDWQDDQGRFEFIKPDGSRWGKTYMCWSMYHWLEAHALLSGAMDAARRGRWEAGLRLSFDGVARELAGGTRLHNIPCWHAMGLVRASEVLGEERWGRLGRELIARHVEAQNPEGYWPEGGGPTTLYNLVYAHAVGLYHAFTGDESVLECLRRALEFHLRFTYPDGTAVETVDGRVKYNPEPIAIGCPGFLPFPQGRGLVSHLVARARQVAPEGRLSPYLAPVALHAPDEPAEAIPQQQGEFLSIHHGRALVRRRGPWFYCLSGYLTPAEDVPEVSRRRWILDRQNCLSVWHERAGLVVGGGNSKGQPEFSTFQVISGKAVWLQADAAALRSDGDGGARWRASCPWR